MGVVVSFPKKPVFSASYFQADLTRCTAADILLLRHVVSYQLFCEINGLMPSDSSLFRYLVEHAD